MSDILQRVQTLQFEDRTAAEALLLTFVRDLLPFQVASVELRPLAVSLNSFNGFLTLDDGKRLFFKTHTEADTVIGEYYNASALAQAGYPIIQPLYSSTEAGRQFLVYEVVEDPSVFDLAWEIEQGTSQDFEALTRAQNRADDDLLQIYLRTLEWQSAEQAARAPIHQLFYHRLTGGRLDRFYGDGTFIQLPGGQIPMAQVRQARWVINGRTYWNKLDGIIDLAIKLLQPQQEQVSIIGHGDAHNGNVFFRRDSESLLYFDPAFAGRHDPLLDLVKPLYHNVFAMWMYHPEAIRRKLNISLRIDGDTWYVEHDYALAPVRLMFLWSKIERVLIPLLRELKGRGGLRSDWYPYLKAALFCCPFLTMNLTDQAKFPPEISLLGLVMAIEMGTMPYQVAEDKSLVYGEGGFIDMLLLHEVAEKL